MPGAEWKPARENIVRRDGWVFNGNEFRSINGRVKFVGPQDLRRLCELARRAIDPVAGKEPRSERERKEIKAARDTLTPEFIIAQHRFYGVPALWKRNEDYVRLFIDAVEAGRVRPFWRRCVARFYRRESALLQREEIADVVCSSRTWRTRSVAWRRR
jgi:hypothetical protein